ncbi:MAG: GNAT family N-acetyltransferase [Phycisphaerales bacterium JB038]
MLNIRPATRDDLQPITAIYNEAIRTSTATFDIDPKTAEEQQRWFDRHEQRHPILVAESEDDVVGWGCLSPWSDRPAYDVTAAFSFYVAAPHRGRGVGTQLLEALITEARRLEYRSLLGCIAEGSEASLRLVRKRGFRQAGLLRQAGHKFGRVLDVRLMQLLLTTERL